METLRRPLAGLARRRACRTSRPDASASCAEWESTAPLRRGRDPARDLARVLRGLRQRHALAAPARLRLARRLRPRESGTPTATPTSASPTAVVERLRPGDLVWVARLPAHARARASCATRRRARGSASSSTSPSRRSEVFRILPEREELLTGLLGADVDRLPDPRRPARLPALAAPGAGPRVPDGPRPGRATAPSSSAALPDRHRRPRSGSAAHGPRWPGRARSTELRCSATPAASSSSSVDRLDYTKGIPERLRTFRRLLEGTPAWRGQVTLIQVAVPSRERVPAYAELRREVAELVGEVNGELRARPSGSPIVYLRRPVERAELAALYAAADVAWVGPLRDGMNLVAKEYVACQRERDGRPRPERVRRRRPGARGGAAHQPLRRGSARQTVLTRALEMPIASQRARAHGRAVSSASAATMPRPGVAASSSGLRGARPADDQRAAATRPARARSPQSLRSAFDAARQASRPARLRRHARGHRRRGRRTQRPAPALLEPAARPRRSPGTTTCASSAVGPAERSRALARRHRGPLAGGRARRARARAGW